VRAGYRDEDIANVKQYSKKVLGGGEQILQRCSTGAHGWQKEVVKE